MRALAWSTVFLLLAIPAAIIGLFIWRKGAAADRLGLSFGKSALGSAAVPVQSPATTSSAGPSTLTPEKSLVARDSLAVLAPFVPTQEHPIDTTEPVTAFTLAQRSLLLAQIRPAAFTSTFGDDKAYPVITIPEGTINPYARANAAREGVYLDATGKQVFKSATSVYAPSTSAYVDMINKGTFTLENVQKVWQGPGGLTA